MNVREIIRSADPALWLRPQTPSETDEQLLRTIVTESQRSAPAPAPPVSKRQTWKSVITTGLVAITVVVGAVVAIRAVPTVTPAPATTPTPTSAAVKALETAVDRKLAAAAKQTSLDPDLPSQIWTDLEQGAQGSAIDLTGKTFFLAAACTGGGTITIQIDGQLDTTIDCTTTVALGPVNLTAIATSAKKGIGYDIHASEGQPEYYAKAIAIARTDTTTTSSVNMNGRTLLIYPASGAGGPQALLHGVLTQNQAGCIAVGNTVVVAPSNAVLHADGSLSFGSTTLTPGTKVDLGGASAGSIPAGSPCKAGADRYFTLGDYPQPQLD